MADRYDYDIEQIRAIISRMQRTLDTHDRLIVHDGLEELKENVEKLNLMICGDPTIDLKGFRIRLENVEKGVSEILEWKKMLRWIMIGVGISGLSNVGTLVAVFSKLFSSP